MIVSCSPAALVRLVCVAAVVTNTVSQAPSGADLIDISGISQDSGEAYLRRQAVAPVSLDNSSFVQRVGGGLRLQGAPFTYRGLNNYYMLQKAADDSSRSQVTEVLDLAQQLGLTVMRMWAFTDGADEFFPLQPEQGMLDPARLADLDWVVSEAQSRGIRLILTVSNYYADYGGFQQYVEWVNASNTSTVTQFYQDAGLQAAYKDYATALILRQNSLTGRLYRDDPGILAWDLANEPANPGDDSGDVLHDWLQMMSAYIKQIDPNHLVYYGTPAVFGATSPYLLLNGNYSGEYSPYGALPWDSACQGEDWARNIALPDIDLASLHTYSPTSFNSDPAVIAARVQAHIQVAAGVGKPLIIDELNGKRPLDRRNAFLNQIFDLAEATGSPVVGTNVWMLSASDYPDYDQFGIYGSAAGASQPLPAGPLLTADWAQTLARRAIFRGFFAADACVRRRLQAAPSYATGWQDTLDIISTNRTFSA